MGNPTLSSLLGLEQRVCGAGVVVLFWCWLLTARKGSQDREQFQAWASLRNAHWQVQSTSTIGEWAAFRTGGTGTPLELFPWKCIAALLHWLEVAESETRRRLMSTKQAAKTHIAGLASRKKNPSK